MTPVWTLQLIRVRPLQFSMSEGWRGIHSVATDPCPVLSVLLCGQVHVLFLWPRGHVLSRCTHVGVGGMPL